MVRSSVTRLCSVAPPVACVLVAALWAMPVAYAQVNPAVAPASVASLPWQPPPTVPIAHRLDYLRKLKGFLQTDPLDMVEFERQFDVKLACRAWRNTGQICDYRATEPRWPYAVFGDHSSVVSYFQYGDGTDDSLWINLLRASDRSAYNCITGGMLQEVFTEPGWSAIVDTAKAQTPRPNSALVLALDGRDQFGRRVSILTMGVKGCTGKLQITVHSSAQK